MHLIVATGAALLCCCACGHREENRRHDSAAFDAGVAAHAIAKKGEKAIEATSRELGKGAHEAYKGWKDAANEDKTREKR